MGILVEILHKDDSWIREALKALYKLWVRLQVFADSSVIVGHNISFDIAFLYRQMGIVIKYPWDTMTYYYMKYVAAGDAPYLKKFGGAYKQYGEGYNSKAATLKSLYQELPGRKHFRISKQDQLYNYSLDNIPEGVYKYSAQDTKVFTELMKEQLSTTEEVAVKIPSDAKYRYYDIICSTAYSKEPAVGLVPYAIERDMRALGVVARLNANGLPVTLEQLEDLGKKYEEDLAALENKFRTEHNVNPYSPSQMSEYMLSNYPELNRKKKVDIYEVATNKIAQALFLDEDTSMYEIKYTRKKTSDEEFVVENALKNNPKFSELFSEQVRDSNEADWYVKKALVPEIETIDMYPALQSEIDQQELVEDITSKVKSVKGGISDQQVMVDTLQEDVVVSEDHSIKTKKVKYNNAAWAQLKNQIGSLNTDTKTLKLWLLQDQDETRPEYKLSEGLKELMADLMELRGIKKRIDKVNELLKIAKEIEKEWKYRFGEKGYELLTRKEISKDPDKDPDIVHIIHIRKIFDLMVRLLDVWRL
jgi:hypothetical protein